MLVQNKFLAVTALVAIACLTPCLAERLRDEVTVGTDIVRLSDLLPLDASARLRATAEKIVLGRAPEPGSVRVFRASELKPSVIGLAGVELPEKVVVRRPGWPIAVASIRESLAHQRVAARFDFSQTEILPAPEFFSRTPNPGLEVIAIRKEPGTAHLLVTMRCRSRHECNCFLVKISFPEAARTSAAEPSETGGRWIADRGTSNIAREAFAVQANHVAILKIEEGGLLITEPVTPLRDARRGEIVPVRSSLGRRVLRAEVIGPDLVRPADGGNKAGLP
jgi:hypothetical protein